jgi:hypothetical protein
MVLCPVSSDSYKLSDAPGNITDDRLAVLYIAVLKAGFRTG